MDVSMAMVRDFTSPKPVSFGSQYPTMPPMRWRRRTGIYGDGMGLAKTKIDSMGMGENF